jgi:hypothetical protein
VFVAFARAPATITKVSLASSIPFFVVGVMDVISSIIRQYSNGNGCNYGITKIDYVLAEFFLLTSSSVEIFQSIARTVSFSLNKYSKIARAIFNIFGVVQFQHFLSVVIFFKKVRLPTPIDPKTKVFMFRFMFGLAAAAQFLPTVK